MPLEENTDDSKAVVKISMRALFPMAGNKNAMAWSLKTFVWSMDPTQAALAGERLPAKHLFEDSDPAEKYWLFLAAFISINTVNPCWVTVAVDPLISEVDSHLEPD